MNTTRKWNLDRDLKLNHEVVEAEWQAERGQWKLTVKHHDDVQTVWADVLLSGQGVLVYVTPPFL